MSGRGVPQGGALRKERTMKYAFMTFSCPDLAFDEVLAAAKRFGYDGVELRICSNHRHGLEWDTPAAARREARRKAEESGVAIACVATSCTLAEPATQPQMIADTKRSIDLAADLGAPCVRVFGGKFSESLSREDAIDSLAYALRTVADHAEARGVTVCLESHDAWCEPFHVAEVMRRCPRPSVGINWDLMHPVRVAGATMDEAFHSFKPWIRHVHFHDGVTADGRLRLAPVGTGEIDHRRAVELLLSIPYEGFLSGEWIGWEPWEVHLPRELAAMKRIEAEVQSE